MIRFLFILLLLSTFQAGAASVKDPDFKKKLVEMAERLDRSSSILRDQISESQQAPFLPDLYLQLAELLMQKANTAYYLYVESQKERDPDFVESGVSAPFKEGQKEAIQVLNLLVRDFPQYNRRSEALYLLMQAHQSIDERIEFQKKGAELIQKYPGTREAVQAQIAIAQYHFEKELLEEAETLYLKASESRFPRERDIAYYKLGVIYSIQGKFKKALDLFVKVATSKDSDLKRSVAEREFIVDPEGANLKREALIESIRAYTDVFKNDPEPVNFYAKITPTENLFREVLEKLAQRYIVMQKYVVAIQILRKLSETTAEPNKVVSMFREILRRMPPNERSTLGASELKFVIEKYNQWVHYFEVSSAQKKEAEDFFEKQLRELGTRAHSLGKKGDKKSLSKAEEFYLLYLAYFPKASAAAVVATNIADIYFEQGRYDIAGDYYMRVVDGEWGKVTDRPKLIKSAIVCGQKTGDFSYYQRLRTRGVLVRAIETYMKLSSKAKRSPQINFIYAKTLYEQRLFDDTLEPLYDYIRRFSNSKYAVLAGELILDYYNTRLEYDALAKAAQSILKLGIKDAAFQKKLAEIRDGAKLKSLYADRSGSTGPAPDGGRGYLELASSVKDRSLASSALRKALSQSKAENDMETFFRSGKLLLEKERDPEKRLELLQGLASEHLAVHRFYDAAEYYKKIYDARYGEPARIEAFQQAVNISLLTKDLNRLSELVSHPLFSKLENSAQENVAVQVSDALGSPVSIPSGLLRYAAQARKDSLLLGLYKGQATHLGGTNAKVKARIEEFCQGGLKKGTVCLWLEWDRQSPGREMFLKQLQRATPQLPEVEKQAVRMQTLLKSMDSLEESGDAELDIALSLARASTYESFSRYLYRVAKANPPLKAVLGSKAKESRVTSEQYLASCGKIAKAANIVSPLTKSCRSGLPPRTPEAFAWNKKRSAQRRPAGQSKDAIKLQQRIFASDKDPNPFLELAIIYYNEGDFNSSSATALQGIARFSDNSGEFKAILACNLIELGMYREAAFHLAGSKEYQGFGKSCLKKSD